MMWKLVRYAVDGEKRRSASHIHEPLALFFYRGRELDDAASPSGQRKGLAVRHAELPGRRRASAVKRLVRKAFRKGQAAI